MANRPAYKQPARRSVPVFERRTSSYIENRTHYKGKTEETDVFAFQNGSIIQFQDGTNVGIGGGTSVPPAIPENAYFADDGTAWTFDDDGFVEAL